MPSDRLRRRVVGRATATVPGMSDLGWPTVRIATWNVNSIRSRIDRVVAWLERNEVDASPSRRPRPARTSSRSTASRHSATRSPTAGSTSGTAWPSPHGSGCPTCRSASTRCPVGWSRSPRRRRPSVPSCGGVRPVVALHPQRPFARGPAPSPTARVARRARRASARGVARRRPCRPDRAARRLEHRPDRRRRLERALLRGQDSHLPRRARRVPGRRRRGVRRRHAPPHVRARHLHLLGLHAAALPQAAGHAHRLRPLLSRPGGAGRGCGGSTARSARARARPITRPSWSRSRTDRARR